jgi:hypothetical protein
MTVNDQYKTTRKELFEHANTLFKFDDQREYGRKDDEISLYSDFETKDEYLKFCKEWKDCYRDISYVLRKFKVEYKNLARRNKSTFSLGVEIQHLKLLARAMLNARAISKEAAEKSYLKQKTLEAVA